MKPKLAFLSDHFKDLVETVSSIVLVKLKQKRPEITKVNYEHGHPLEVIETMGQLAKSSSTKFDRYPLVALFQPYEEKYGGDYVEVNLHLIIAVTTDENWKAEKRLTENFKPILYPIYQTLFEQISYSRLFNILDVNSIDHIKIDQFAWGKSGLYGMEGNIFNDRIDAIEIKNLKIKVNLNTC